MEKSFLIYSDYALGGYAFKLNKAGDGNYYANLPILFLRFDDRSTIPFEFSLNNMKIYTSSKDNTTYDLVLVLNCRPPT